MNPDPEMRAEIFESLDERARECLPCRYAEIGDPPPAAPPVEGYVWDRFDEIWRESDAQLRARIASHLAPFPIRPVLGRIIIEIEEAGEEESASGLIVRLDSGRADEKEEGRDRVGRVVAIDHAFYDSPRNAPHIDGMGAPRERLDPPDFKVGDRVFFAVSWAGESFEWEGKRYHVLEGEDAALLLSPDANLKALTR